MPPLSLLITTDANPCIGMGHLMRCLALAQAWREAGGQVALALSRSSVISPSTRDNLNQNFTDIFLDPRPPEDSARTVAIAKRTRADWVVLDGYHFGSSLQSALKARGFRVLFVDDHAHSDFYSADFVLNQNAHAAEGMYQNRQSYTRLLLGTKYALLRQEFLGWSRWKRKIPALARKLLVTFGGSDPRNLTLPAMQAIERIGIPGLQTIVVVGAGNPYLTSVNDGFFRSRGCFRIERNVADMASLMSSVDLAISAAGSTCLEMCRMGLPAIVFSVAENQLHSARELDRLGCVVHLEFKETFAVRRLTKQVEELIKAQDKRRQMSRNGRQQVDGNGAKRVVSAMLQHSTNTQLTQVQLEHPSE